MDIVDELHTLFEARREEFEIVDVHPTDADCRGATASARGGTREQGNKCTHENHKAGGARKEISARMKSTIRR